MRKSIFLVFLLMTIIISSTHAQMSDTPYNALSITHDGTERLAHIHEPDSDPQAAIIALHTIFSSGRAMEALTGLNPVADERGWVVAYPEALQPYWDDGRASVDLPPDNGEIDDAGYLAALADQLRETYGITDVYITGISNGGTMAMRAVCEYPNTFNGLAVVAASMWAYQVDSCNTESADHPINVIVINGIRDHVYWAEGRPIGNNPSWTILSYEAHHALWADRYLCDTPETAAGNSALSIAANCTDSAQVAHLSIEGVGNYWVRDDETALNQTGLDTAQIIGAFLSDDDDWQAHTMQSNTPNNEPRSYITYVPTTYDQSTPTPVVISLHGRGANNISQALSSGWNAVAEQHGFIVIYPQAYDPNYNNPQEADAVWNYNLGVPVFENLGWNDDLFLDHVVDEVATTLNVDMNRLYMTGLSNGGYMTHRLACTRSDRYAAFATMAANAPFGLTELCQPTHHAPILIYHGTADTISPWQGATIRVPGRSDEIFLLAPIPNSVAFWLAQNECEMSYNQTDLPNTDDKSRVIRVQYDNCPIDSAVELYAVVGGGHVWHGVNDVQNNFLGEDNMDINASEAIWDFYSQYSLEGRADTTIPNDDINDTTLTGNGIPNLPLTLERQITADTSTPQGQIIAGLQSGGLIIYFAVDLSETPDCNAVVSDDAFLTRFTDNAAAFTQLDVVIDRVFAWNDCRTATAGSVFDAASFIGIGDIANEMPVALNTVPVPGRINIIVGDAGYISDLVGQEVAANQSVLIQPSGTDYRALAIVPPNGWTGLLDN